MCFSLRNYMTLDSKLYVLIMWSLVRVWVAVDGKRQVYAVFMKCYSQLTQHLSAHLIHTTLEESYEGCEALNIFPVRPTLAKFFYGLLCNLFLIAHLYHQIHHLWLPAKFYGGRIQDRTNLMSVSVLTRWCCEKVVSVGLASICFSLIPF